jgi:hypothetical protein
MSDFYLTEYELNDIAELLASIPTKTDTVEKEKVESCAECASNMCIVYDVENERIDTMSREFILTLVERVGAIHDKARARELHAQTSISVL